jgi:hypothetical protein
MAEMIGRSPPELIGTPFEQMCHKIGFWSEPCPVKEGMTTGKVTHAIRPCQIKPSEPDRYLMFSCFPQRNLAAEVTHAIVSIRDVSAIVKAEMLQKDLIHMIAELGVKSLLLTFQGGCDKRWTWPERLGLSILGPFIM